MIWLHRRPFARVFIGRFSFTFPLVPLLMDFQKRLEKAVERGARTSDARHRAEAESAHTEEELRRQHTQIRLQLSDHIESCLKQLSQHFPGFRFELISGDRGWGAAVNRDDLVLDRGQRGSHFSRLEMFVRPYTTAHVIELAAKGTIHNKEVYNRSQYQRLGQIDITSFQELTDLWVLEFAELYAAKR